MCCITSLADVMCLKPENHYDPSEPSWFLPLLRDSKSSSAVLSNIVKDLLPGAAGCFSNFTVDDLPKRLTAGSFRSGACCDLLLTTALEHAVVTTGHKLTSVSAFFEYIRTLTAHVSFHCEFQI